MSPEHARQALKEVSRIAAVAGVPARVDEEGEELVVEWPSLEGRPQEVRIRPSDETDEGAVVTFEAVCWLIRKREWKRWVRRYAGELLRFNADLLTFARFGMRPTGREDPATVVVASVDHLLATLDAEEFRAAARHVAAAAELFDEKF